MSKRSPWESYHQRQREIDRKVFDLIQSTKHMCLCSHAQGFHWDTDHAGVSNNAQAAVETALMYEFLHQTLAR
jgi:hypothetical protein